MYIIRIFDGGGLVISYYPKFLKEFRQLTHEEMSACGCMGPQYDEPYCPCVMRSKGIPRTDPIKYFEEQRYKKNGS